MTDVTQTAFDMDFLTLGFRWFSSESYGGWNWNTELAWQTANYALGTGATGSDADGSGSLFDGEVSYQFD